MLDAAKEKILKAVDFLRRRQVAYRMAFSSPISQQVLQDLARFCRANDSTFHPDPRMHAVLEGRREVWLRIQRHLNLNVDQLFALYEGRTINLVNNGEKDDD